MKKFIVPQKRTFTKGDKKTVSIRLPEGLKTELEKQADHFGRGFSDYVQDALDQYAQFIRQSLDSDE